MIKLTPIVSKAKSIWYKPKKGKKLALNSQLLTVQILTNDVLILCLSYSITTVLSNLYTVGRSSYVIIGWHGMAV